MGMKKRLLFILAIFMMLTVGCGGNTGTDGEEGVQVYTSIYPLYDFTSKIAKGADDVNVELLIPEGTEPHGWEPDTKDMNRLEKGDVFIYNGAGLESWTDKVLNSLDNKDLISVEASKGVDLMKATHHHHEDDHDHDEHEHHHHGGTDPHVWLSPKNAKIESENIKDALIQAAPGHKELFEKNYEKLAGELDSLDKEFQEGLKDRKRNEIVVSHEAFAYLCRDYGLEQLGIEGVNSEKEPDPKTMAKIVDYVNEKGIRVIFTETLIDPKVSETIAKETGAETMVLNPLEGLTAEQREDGEDYFSIMRDNLNSLKKALF